MAAKSPKRPKKAHAAPARPPKAREAHDAPVDRETLKRSLKTKGLRWTQQRETILDYFLAAEGHLTCEEIHRRVAAKDRTIGLSTVYRTLHMFVEAGVASERHFQDGVTRFEIVQPHHDHLICLGCGTIVEFEREDVERLQDEVAKDHGFRLVSHRHELYGYCKRC